MGGPVTTKHPMSFRELWEQADALAKRAERERALMPKNPDGTIAWPMMQPIKADPQ